MTLSKQRRGFTPYHFRKSGKGFTLIETVIVVALTVIMMVAISSLIYMFNKIASFERASSQSSTSASSIMREMESLVLPARAVLQTHMFSTGTYASGSVVLVLEIPSIDSSGVVIAATYDYAVFYVVGTSAYRRLEANAASSRFTQTKLLSSSVDSLSFAFDDAVFANISSVTVDLETEAQVKKDIVSDHRREQLVLRNH